MNSNRDKVKSAETMQLIKRNKNPPQVRQTLTSKYRLLKANTSSAHELGKKLETSTSMCNRGPPQIRQTLTSKYRLLKANPLLAHELGKKVETSNNTDSKEEDIVKPLKTLVRILDAESGNPQQKKKIASVNVNDKRLSKSFSSQSFLAKPGNAKQRICPKTVQPQKLTQSVVQDKNCNIKANNNKPKHIDKNIKPPAVNVAVTSSTLPSKCVKNNQKPLAINLNAEEMAALLKDWLKQNGKDFKDYYNLKSFGLDDKKEPNDDSDKENDENNIVVTSGSYEDLKISTDEVNKNLHLSTIAEDALVDLHKLIQEGYPAEQCEIWLKLVKQKYRELEEKPQYWECRAALEQSKGNINSAVECYKTAIIQGAEIKSVDKQLDHLLQKFTLLDINEELDLCKNSNKSKVVQDVRNIFKSSIIQFAVQERILKKISKEGVSIEKKLIATPVRRSTRLSRSRFASTPGIHLYSSLRDLDSSVRNTLNFQCNNALKD